METIYVVQEVTIHNLKDFVCLFNNERKKRFKLDYFKSKFFETPLKTPYIGFLAYIDGKPVAHCGAIPMLFRVNNETLVAAQWSDTVTSKKYQNLGLNRLLTTKVLEKCKELDIAFIFRFSNNVSSQVVRKYGWIELPRLKVYKFSIKALPVFRILTKFKFNLLYKLYFRSICFLFFGSEKRTNVGQSFNVIQNNSLDYSIDYINYKSFSINRILEIEEGLFCWCGIEEGLMVGHLSSQDLNLKTFLSKISKFCFWAGLENVKFIISDNHPWEYNLSKHQNAEEGNFVFIHNLNIELKETPVFNSCDRNIF